MMKKHILTLVTLLGFGFAFAAVDINSATSEELQTLGGIGKVRADAIVEYREAHGPFKVKEDLKEVSGIGDKTFEKLKGDIVVGESKSKNAERGGAGKVAKPAVSKKSDKAGSSAGK